MCPDGWWRRNRRCYRFGPNPGVYNAAVDTCGSLGGTPFVPNSKAEFDALGDYAADRGISFFWLGCDDLIVERTFDCFDGSQILESSRKLQWVLRFDGSLILKEKYWYQKIPLLYREDHYSTANWIFKTSIAGSRLAHLCMHHCTVVLGLGIISGLLYQSSLKYARGENLRFPNRSALNLRNKPQCTLCTLYFRAKEKSWK